MNAYATDYKWSSSVNKKEAFVNEAIYLKYVCEYSDKAELYTIEFHPEVENEFYSIKLFSQKTKLVDTKKISTYEYIAFVKKPMLANFNFEAMMEKTNKDSIENTVLGRDNADYEEFSTTPVKQKSLKVEIKEIQTNISGKFSLEVKKDKQRVKAYEPFHLDIKISGTGNFEALGGINFNIDGVKVFAQKPINSTYLGIEGYKGTWSQKFAFVGSKDFRIPAQSIKYFDIESKEVKVLNIASINISVKKAYQKSELLDTQENGYAFSLDTILKYIYFILTFITGFLLAKVKFKTKRRDTKSTQLRDKIQNAKSLNELSMLLILNNERKFNDILTKIDSKELSSLAHAKNKITKLITDT
ncbi:hypothetical protein [Sulfurimonas sp.]|uniref:hypothetical protein n=1 Tax=Sulfurimonas sp. TaxID=2022749 RepID=UPI0039E4FC68